MTAAPSSPSRRAFRAPEEALLGGVAAGLAEHLRVPVLWVRLGFLAATLLNGAGVAMYIAFWIMLPERRSLEVAPGLAAATRQGRRARPLRMLADQGPLVAAGAVVLGLMLWMSMSGVGGMTLPAVLAIGGLGLLWWQVDDARSRGGRANPFAALLGGGVGSPIRLVAGVALLVSAITLFVVTALGVGSLGSIVNVGVAALLGLVAISLIVGPWLRRLSADLTDERAERIRSQERADVAAHLHDSVLQTLALIQKSAGDPAAVARLARSQERDLRTWLFEAPTSSSATLASALKAACAEVEDATGVRVEVVVVGDAPLDAALVAAAREAAFNAATHSGAAQVDVYAEVGAELAEVFVRDRGRGFDPSATAPDRHGVKDSIIGRVERAGGSVEIRSEIGGGTEVRLRQPLAKASS